MVSLALFLYNSAGGDYMKKILFLLVAIMFFSGCGYNHLQNLEEGVFKSWADLESNMQRRSDLIPNLVATVKGYATHESQTLENVINARSKATSVQITVNDLSNTKALEQFQQAQGELRSALGRLMAVSESYPDLKANQQFRDLMHQLEGTENRINVARQRYNDAVQSFNAAIRRFPYTLTNNWFLQLERKEYFRATEEAKEVPKVEF
jgi:LemA protein